MAAAEATPLKVILAGIGKIARDQHLPVIDASPDWELAATVSRHGTVPGTPSFTDLAACLEAVPDATVVSLCMPPVPRFAYAEAALKAGRHVMLEKPPGATVSEVIALGELAKARGLTLFATWHSRMAFCVARAKAWLAEREIRSAHINWAEDVRRWHPGQDWIWEPGGMGVFDPGINALSILTEILPAPVHLTEAELEVPANRQAPIAARLTFTGNVTARFDWRQTGPQSWDITVETDGGRLDLADGGARMLVDGSEIARGPDIEYRGLYDRMADLVRRGASDVDLAPMLHVADAFTLGRRVETEPFHD